MAFGSNGAHHVVIMGKRFAWGTGILLIAMIVGFIKFT
jgi:hypothetical protein